MNDILESYKKKLDETIINIKWKIRESTNLDEALDSIRDELSGWGKDNLRLMFQELKDYAEKNSAEFIKQNKDRWESILDKAEALTEYGLYVAPVDLLNSEDNMIKAVYAGTGAFISSVVLTKIATKKAKVLPSLLTSVISGAAVYYFLGLNSEDDMKNTAINYIDDAYDWIKTAFENMNRIFKDAQ